ncbi:MAG: COG4280 domain-containing protein [Rhizobiaceae bacterium]
MDVWTTAAPAVAAAFLASLVEVVEAFTIVLAVATVRGWKPALLGTGAALVVLAVLVSVFGPLLRLVPLHALQFVVGLLLLLFGLRWLRKAILREAGLVAQRDETAAFEREIRDLHGAAPPRHAIGQQWIAGLAAFKAVTLEGVEVVFIVLAVGAGRGLLGPAALGAVGAFLLVLLAGLALHRPLARVPENRLKFAVGVMLSAFGVFWTGEGLGVGWPGGDLAIPVLAVFFLLVGLLAVAAVGHRKGLAR